MAQTGHRVLNVIIATLRDPMTEWAVRNVHPSYGCAQKGFEWQVPTRLPPDYRLVIFTKMASYGAM